MIDNKKLFTFLGFTFLIDWLIGALYYYLHAETNIFQENRFIPMAVAVVFMLVPAIVSIVMIKAVYRQKLSDYGVHLKITPVWLFVWGFPFIIAGLTIVFTQLFGWGRLDFTMESFIADLEGQLPAEDIEEAREQLTSIALPLQYALMFLQTIIAGTTINAVAAFGEEMGWRGLLYQTLRPLGFWKTNLLIGVIWGIWHAPIILTGYNFPDHPVAGVFVMTAACTLLAVLFGYLREATGSVLAASVFHGVFNAIAGITIIIVADTENIYRSPLGFAGMAAMTLLIGALYPFFKGYIQKNDTMNSAETAID